ncbi:unnamed protein product [Ceratitis capitata]|uniref:(Mediterranean fruit fly) hypothetical protein n=1 Tax=Ceratitis capitata TaxID=7213 RepID=A0A811UC62_CERCA|nr:unnamed protein product [Ceratitis capitata]
MIDKHSHKLKTIRETKHNPPYQMDEQQQQQQQHVDAERHSAAGNFAPVRYNTINGGRSDPPDYMHAKLIEPLPSVSPLPVAPSPNPQLNGHVPKVPPPGLIPSKLIRKPSIERETPINYLHRCSPALDSGAGSSRSDSPHSHQQVTNAGRVSTGQYSPSPSSFSDVGPPAPPPRHPTTGNSATPPPPPPNQYYKRRSPANTRPAAITPNPTTRGTSPVIVRNGIKAQQQLSQMKALSLYQASGSAVDPPPPPYPINTGVGATSAPPPSYTASMQSRQSPTQSQSDYRKSPSSGIYSATSAGSPSPITVTNSAILPLQPTTVARPQPRTYARTQQPIIMHSVRSTQVQKPVLQTAVAPQTPVSASACNSPVHIMSAPPSYPQKSAAAVQQQQAVQQQSPLLAGAVPTTLSATGKSTTPTTPPLIANALNGNVVSKPICIEPPSYTVTMQAKAAQHHQQQQQPTAAQLRAVANVALAAQQQQQKQVSAVPMPIRQLPPPPPYQSTRAAAVPPTHSVADMSGNNNVPNSKVALHSNMMNNNQIMNSNLTTTPPIPPAKNSGGGGSGGTVSSGSGGGGTSPAASDGGAVGKGGEKIKHASPIPERKKVSKEKEEERKECRITQYSPQAYKFYMEQHIENVIKSCKQRAYRKNQLEKRCQGCVCHNRRRWRCEKC